MADILSPIAGVFRRFIDMGNGAHAGWGSGLAYVGSDLFKKAGGSSEERRVGREGRSRWWGHR